MLQNLQNTGKVQPTVSGAGQVRQENQTPLTDAERKARRREIKRQWRAKNAERARAQRRDYYQRTREARLAWQRQYRARNDRRQKQREYYERNRETLLTKQREYYFRRKCKECGVAL